MCTFVIGNMSLDPLTRYKNIFSCACNFVYKTGMCNTGKLYMASSKNSISPPFTKFLVILLGTFPTAQTQLFCLLLLSNVMRSYLIANKEAMLLHLHSTILGTLLQTFVCHSGHYLYHFHSLFLSPLHSHTTFCCNLSLFVRYLFVYSNNL